jgi:hypothetical protein
VSAVRLAVAACLATVGVLAALLATDVRSWRAALESGDGVYAAVPARASWSASPRLGGLAEEVLALEGEVELRRGLQRYGEAAGLQARLDNAIAVAAARDRAAKALFAAARDSDRRGASQALTLLGILAFGAVSRGGDSNQVDAALSDFTDAVRADPANESAKFDLELLLRSTAASGVRIGPGPGGGLGKSGRRGAGGGVPGRGY